MSASESRLRAVGQDFVGCLGPGEGVAAIVPAHDEGRADELFDAGEGSESDRLAVIIPKTTSARLSHGPAEAPSMIDGAG